MSEGRTREFFIRQFSDLRAEGAGMVNGNFFLWGTIALMSSGLIHVSMKGWTGAMEIAQRHSGTVEWWGSACLLHAAGRGPTMRLLRSGTEAWSNARRYGRLYQPIGSCLLKMPETGDPSRYTVLISGGYSYNGVTPLPSVATDEVALPAATMDV